MTEAEKDSNTQQQQQQHHQHEHNSVRIRRYVAVFIVIATVVVFHVFQEGERNPYDENLVTTTSIKRDVDNNATDIHSNDENEMMGIESLQGTLSEKINTTNSLTDDDMMSSSVSNHNMSSINMNISDAWIEQCVSDHNLEMMKNGTEETKSIPLNVSKLWEGYRLGDCIKSCSKSVCKWRGGDPDLSLAGGYYHRACKTELHVTGGNFTIVASLFEDYSKINPGFFDIPDSDALVIHLRLGDVIEKSEADVTTMLARGARPYHPGNFGTSIKSVHEYLEDIVWLAKTTKVIIVGGAHHKKHNKKSRVYADCLYQGLELAGLDITLQINARLPDQDFYYMSHATKISVSTGGYSRLVGQLATYFGGHIIGRSFRQR